MRLNELGFYRKGPFGSSLTKDMFVPYSKSVIKVYEQKNAIQKDYRLGHYYISDTKFNQMQSFVTNPGDIIVSCAGTIGETYQLPDDAPIGIINQALMRVCLYEKSISEYWQMSFDYILLVNSEMKGAGSAIKNIPPFDVLKSLLVPIPPIAEQNRILSQYRILQSKIRAFETLNSDLERLNSTIFEKLKKSVLQEAIQGKLVPQDPNDEPASVLLERTKEEKAKLLKEGKLKKKDLVDSVIFKGEDNKYYETIDGKTECIDERIPFDLPHNWCWGTLGNLVQNCSGLAYKKENLDERSTSYIRVLRGGNIDDGQWTMKDDDVMIASKFVKPELLLTAGTFITPAVTSIEQMGKTALVRDNQPQTVVGGFVLMLLPFLRDWSLLDYLELIFQSEYYKGYCRSITNKSGQAFYNLSRQKLMQFLVPLPPLNERIAIANEVAKINSMMR